MANAPSPHAQLRPNDATSTTSFLLPTGPPKVRICAICAADTTEPRPLALSASAMTQTVTDGTYPETGPTKSTMRGSLSFDSALIAAARPYSVNSSPSMSRHNAHQTGPRHNSRSSPHFSGLELASKSDYSNGDGSPAPLRTILALPSE